MKRLACFVLILLVILSIAADLGANSAKCTGTKNIRALQEHRVEPGETVLSIIEANHDASLPNVRIADIVADFRKYNDGMNPYEIVPGQTYLFPVYEK